MKTFSIIFKVVLGTPSMTGNGLKMFSNKTARVDDGEVLFA